MNSSCINVSWRWYLNVIQHCTARTIQVWYWVRACDRKILRAKIICTFKSWRKKRCADCPQVLGASSISWLSLGGAPNIAKWNLPITSFVAPQLDVCSSFIFRARTAIFRIIFRCIGNLHHRTTVSIHCIQLNFDCPTRRLHSINSFITTPSPSPSISFWNI